MPIERRSVVEVGGLEWRGIGSGSRSWWPNHYKTWFAFLFLLFTFTVNCLICLLLSLRLRMSFQVKLIFPRSVFIKRTKIFKIDVFIVCTNSPPPPLSTDSILTVGIITTIFLIWFNTKEKWLYLAFKRVILSFVLPSSMGRTTHIGKHEWEISWFL